MGASVLNGLGRTVVILALGLPNRMQTLGIPAELFEFTTPSSQEGSEQVDSRGRTTLLGKGALPGCPSEARDNRPEPATCRQSAAFLVTETPLSRRLGNRPSA